MTARAIIAFGLFLILFSLPAFGHGQWAWVMDYNNKEGMNCCGPMDTVFIPHETANAAQIGTVIVANFHGVKEAVVVNKIYTTKDPKGRAVITRYGCLFRWSGG